MCVGPAPIGAADLDSLYGEMAAVELARDDAAGGVQTPATAMPQPLITAAPSPAPVLPAGGSKAKVGPDVSPSPAASPTPRGRYTRERRKGRKITVGIASYTSFVDQHFGGPGIAPPEGTFFAPLAAVQGAAQPVCITAPFGTPAGLVTGSAPGSCSLTPGLGVVAPQTPYDYASGGPLVSGNGIHQATILTPMLHVSPAIDWSATVGYGSVGGTANVAQYWGQNIMAPINAHLGQHPASDNGNAAFPVAPGQNSTSVSRVTFLNTAIARTDGKATLKAGWFDLSQTEGHVFAPPLSPQTLIGPQPTLAEGLSDGYPTMELFKPLSSTLQLYGADYTMAVRKWNLEATDAELPAPADSPVRVLSLSAHSDRGHGLTYGAQIARVFSSGAPIASTFLFGSGPGVAPSALGPVPFSALSGQKMVIGGVDATFALTPDIDASLKYGHSCYGASGTSLAASSCAQGSFYYAKLHKGFKLFDFAFEGLRYESTYAPMVLPFGTVENTWSAPDTWPGGALKGAYTFVDNHLAGPNRQGARFSATFVVKGIESRLAYAQYGQIQPYDGTTAYAPGFLETYFLPQLGGRAGGTLGGEQHMSATFLAHPKLFDVQLDLGDVTMSRAASPGHPDEAVAMNYPSAVFSLSRTIKPDKLFVSVGAGRYALDGSFSNSGNKNVNLSEDVVFGGFELLQNKTSGYYLQYRLFSVRGTPATPLGPSPNFHGPQIYLEQRLKT